MGQKGEKRTEGGRCRGAGASVGAFLGDPWGRGKVLASARAKTDGRISWGWEHTHPPPLNSPPPSSSQASQWGDGLEAGFQPAAGQDPPPPVGTLGRREEPGLNHRRGQAA